MDDCRFGQTSEYDNGCKVHNKSQIECLCDTIRALKLQVEAIRKSADASHKAASDNAARASVAEAKAREFELQIAAIPKKLLDATLAEQDRCAKIAEYFWDHKTKDDFKLDSNTAYTISTQIRALRRRESDFTEKRVGTCDRTISTHNDRTAGYAVCGEQLPCRIHDVAEKKVEQCAHEWVFNWQDKDRKYYCGKCKADKKEGV